MRRGVPPWKVSADVGELEASISKGVARMVIVRDFELVEAWRGHGLGAPLIAGALRSLARSSRRPVARGRGQEALSRWRGAVSMSSRARRALISWVSALR